MGRRTSTDTSQAAHSASNRQGRPNRVSATGSRVPASRPTSPPSILAAAVAGSGVPAVQRLNAIQGESTATGMPREARLRFRVSGPPSQSKGTSSTDSGRASAAAPMRSPASVTRPEA